MSQLLHLLVRPMPRTPCAVASISAALAQAASLTQTYGRLMRPLHCRVLASPALCCAMSEGSSMTLARSRWGQPS